MTWTERQRAMLAEMGLRVWDAPAAGEKGVAASAAPAVAEVRLTSRPPDAVIKVAPSPVAIVPNAAISSALGTASSMDWPALREAVTACTACSLH